MKRRQIQVMLASMILASVCGGAITSYAADETHTTDVRYTGSKEGQEEYEVSVPAMLVPGGDAGEVKLSGLWRSTHTINVVAPDTVDMANDIDNEIKTINVNFDDIHQSGDNNAETTVTKNISVDALEGALLGNWSGRIVYTISATDVNGDELHVHEWEEEFTVDQEADCTTDGSKSIHCMTCDEVKDVTPILSQGHQMDPATGNCTVCNDPALHTHVWDADFTIDTDVSCTADGQKSIHCAGCDEVKDVTPIVSTGHNFVDGECTECGEAE